MKTREELDRIRQEMPESVRHALEQCEGLSLERHEEHDKYGWYSTGLFRYKGKDILITMDDGRWHMSVNCKHPLGYYELKELRYTFLPDRCHMAQIFPPRAEFVNVAENCYHLYELGND